MCLSARRGVVHRHHARADALTETPCTLGIVGVDRAGETEAVAIAQFDRLVQGIEYAKANQRTEGFVRIQLVAWHDAFHDGGVRKDARLGIAHKPLARIRIRDAANSSGAMHLVVRLDPIQMLEVVVEISYFISSSWIDGLQASNAWWISVGAFLISVLFVIFLKEKAHEN